MYKIYLFRNSGEITEKFIEDMLDLLPEERREKAMRYRLLNDRKNCVITYLMLKIALKQCFDIEDFTLRYGDFGKPFLREYPDIFFNISHCSTACAVAVATGPMGIDIQNIRPFTWEIVRRVCCREELKLLKNSSDKDREFLKIWSKKESFVKMTGQGLNCCLPEINTLHKDSIQTVEIGDCVMSIDMEEKKTCIYP